MNIGKYVERYSEELNFKGYSKNTIENYCCQVNAFLHYFNDKVTKPSEIKESWIKSWIMEAQTTNTRKHRISSVKSFYKYVGKQPLKFRNIEYPRSEKKLPQPLSEYEVKSLFDHCTNLKHRAIMALLFGCGMRVSEVLNLKPSHIDRHRKVINIISGKGNKDRLVPMGPELLSLLERYWRQYKSKEYMFNGQFDVRYSDRSINQFLKDIAKKAGIKRNIHSHLGRHSYASQLWANGTELGKIREILGHASEKTTRIYTKCTAQIIANVPSPYSFAL